MTEDRVDRTVVTQEPTPAAGQEPSRTAAGQEPVRPAATQETVRTDSRSTTRTGPGASETTRRVIVLLFGLIQIVIGARIVLLLLNAREANGLVKGILDISQLFVAPFNGILQVDYLKNSGSVFDIAAVLAFVGWTILELIAIWAVGIFRREQT